MNLNWVDLIIILLIIYFAFEAYGRPVVLEFLDLASFLLALLISFRYYNFPADFLQSQFSLPHGLSLVIGFMLAWFLTETLFFIATRLILGYIPKIHSYGGKFLSIIPAILRGLIFISLLLVLVATFPMQPSLKRAVNESKIGSILLKNAYQLEQPIKTVFGGLSNDTLTFLTIKPKTSERVNLGFQTDQFKIDEPAELGMIGLVNKERLSRGLNSLQFDSKLREVARLHSSDMFKRGYFAHVSPEGASVADRAEKVGVDYLIIGENLAFAPSLELAHQGLMNSDGHRANILSPEFNKMGIGVMDGAEYGRMFTQVFSN